MYLHFSIGDEITININGKEGKATLIGYELGWWLDPLDWIWIVLIKEYPFSLSIEQSSILKGCHIITNGIAARVLKNEETTTK